MIGRIGCRVKMRSLAWLPVGVTVVSEGMIYAPVGENGAGAIRPRVAVAAIEAGYRRAARSAGRPIDN
jgi:hypothetical protein